jgi:hypothetical protein
VEPLDLALIPLGVAVGAFGALVGAGGGFVLVPVLLLLFPDRPPEQISAMGLFVVFWNALSGAAAYARQKRIDFLSAAWLAAGTLPGALAGVYAVGFVPRRAFDAIFATLLGAVGLWLLVRRTATAIRTPISGRWVLTRQLRDRDGIRYFYAFHIWKAVGLSAGIGFFSSLLGIGGGVVQVPVMATVLHFPIHIATATSQTVLVVMSGEGTAVHMATGNLGWDRALGQAALIAVGAVPGAQVGAAAARRLHGGVILRLLALALVLVAVRIGLKAAGVG